MNYTKLLVSFMLCILFSSSAGAGCLVLNENERLSNFCLLESIKGRLFDQNTALTLG